MAETEQNFPMAGCERLWKKKNQKGALYVNNRLPSPSALVMQNSCVEFFLNFMFTSR